MDCLSPDDIYAAAKQLSNKIINTPTLPAPALSELLGCQLYLKHEQLQQLHLQLLELQLQLLLPPAAGITSCI